MIATTQDVVAVSAVLEVGPACQAGVNAVAPQAVLGAMSSAAMPVAPCTVTTSTDGLPAVAKFGCFADVAAPVGSAIVPEILLMFHVPPWLAVTTVPAPPDCCNCPYSG